MDRPLTVQSDRTMLLDVHSPFYSSCRSDIIAFSELIKSPEHVHSYQITNLSIWNAVSRNIDSDEIIKRLEKWSKYEIDGKIIYFIKDMASRMNDFILEERDEETYLLTVKRTKEKLMILNDAALKEILTPVSDNSFSLSKKNRGALKAKMIKLSFPVDDRIPLVKGKPLSFSLRNFTPRPYQTDAAESLLGDGKRGSGYGTIVLPCGSGKTMVGIIIMQKISANTLILTPNVIAVRQWIKELLDKTTLDSSQIGEYSGEKKEIRSVTISTYQMVTFGSGSEEFLTERIKKLSEGGWGLIIYDEVHMLPAPVFRLSAEMQSLHRVGLTATLVREDGREDEVFSLVGPKRYDSPWSDLASAGYIAKAMCHEIRVALSDEDEINYALSERNERFRIAAENPKKLEVAKYILDKHKGEQILIIGQYLKQLEFFSTSLSAPLITGRMGNKRREELYSLFREGEIKILVVSKVANAAIDLPDASIALQISGSFGSRQEEAQRLGRIMRPKDRDSHFYTLVSEHTVEEEFAQNREKFLCEQGYTYSLERIEI